MFKNTKKYAITNAVLLDGTEHMTPQTGKIVCIDGDRIVRICDGGAPAGFEEVNLDGMYLMPGLINMHVHLPASGKPKKKPSDPKKLVKLITSNGLTRRVGVKYVRGLCKDGAAQRRDDDPDGRRRGRLRHDHPRPRSAAGEMIGPRVAARRTWPFPSPAGTWSVRSPTRRAARRRPRTDVRSIAAGKARSHQADDHRRRAGREGQGRAGRAADAAGAGARRRATTAHALGMRVAAHVESPEGVRVALENGVDSIEHGAKPDEDILSRCSRERGAAFMYARSPPRVPLRAV